MCSICGIVNYNERISREVVEKMNAKMKHRGPNESDIFEGECACFGHNRLSVVDIENGHQPMSVQYGNKKYTIVYKLTNILLS
jgi:asparagine synthase (glutamine-hydrolysing)